jgi:hypothetical protein
MEKNFLFKNSLGKSFNFELKKLIYVGWFFPHTLRLTGCKIICINSSKFFCSCSFQSNCCPSIIAATNMDFTSGATGYHHQLTSCNKNDILSLSLYKRYNIRTTQILAFPALVKRSNTEKTE